MNEMSSLAVAIPTVHADPALFAQLGALARASVPTAPAPAPWRTGLTAAGTVAALACTGVAGAAVLGNQPEPMPLLQKPTGSADRTDHDRTADPRRKSREAVGTASPGADGVPPATVTRDVVTAPEPAVIPPLRQRTNDGDHRDDRDRARDRDGDRDVRWDRSRGRDRDRDRSEGRHDRDDRDDRDASRVLWRSPRAPGDSRRSPGR